jgi:ribose transport system ATP-binding protein
MKNQNMPLPRMRGIVKDFPIVRALNRVDTVLISGKVHCRLSENGAGKSTVTNKLSGVYLLNSDGISLNGKLQRQLAP